jgi:hypothetical protein
VNREPQDYEPSKKMGERVFIYFTIFAAEGSKGFFYRGDLFPPFLPLLKNEAEDVAAVWRNGGRLRPNNFRSRSVYYSICKVQQTTLS